MKVKLKKRGWIYQRPFFPTRWWRPKELFNRFNWIPGVYPSYPRGMLDLFDNIMVFLTPWYRCRRNMMKTFIVCNDGKLLNHYRKSAELRTRTEDAVYYTLRFGLAKARLLKTVYVDRESGKPQNIFIDWALRTLGGESDRELLEKTETTDLGICLTRKQCQRALDKITELSPDLDWYDYEEGQET